MLSASGPLYGTRPSIPIHVTSPLAPTTDLIIRRIRPDEGKALRLLRMAALRDSPSAFGSNLEREMAFAESEWDDRANDSATGNLAATFLAEDGEGAWLGLVVVLGPLHSANHSNECAELVSMWVARPLRKLGIGFLLINAAIDFAKKITVPFIGLSLTRDNHAAYGLYTRCGFHEVAMDLPDNHCCATEKRMKLRL